MEWKKGQKGTYHMINYANFLKLNEIIVLEVRKVVNFGQGGGGVYCLKQTMGRRVLWWDSKVLFCDLDTFTFTQLCKIRKLIVSVNYTLFYVYAYILYFNKSLKNWTQSSKYVSFSGNPCSFYFFNF